MKLFKKIFRSEATVSVDAAETWRVEWCSRHGEYVFDYRKEVEIFVNKEEAMAFKKALEDAFQLLKYKGSITAVNLMKN